MKMSKTKQHTIQIKKDTNDSASDALEAEGGVGDLGGAFFFERPFALAFLGAFLVGGLWEEYKYLSNIKEEGKVK